MIRKITVEFELNDKWYDNNEDFEKSLKRYIKRFATETHGPHPECFITKADVLEISHQE